MRFRTYLQLQDTPRVGDVGLLELYITHDGACCTLTFFAVEQQQHPTTGELYNTPRILGGAVLPSRARSEFACVNSSIGKWLCLGMEPKAAEEAAYHLFVYVVRRFKCIGDIIRQTYPNWWRCMCEAYGEPTYTVEEALAHSFAQGYVQELIDTHISLHAEAGAVPVSNDYATPKTELSDATRSSGHE